MITLKYLLSLTFSLISIISVNAQWKKLGLPYGFTINSSYIDQDGNIMIETADANYYSSDLGETWVNTGKYITKLSNLIEFENDLYYIESKQVFKFSKTSLKWESVYTSNNNIINMDSNGFIWSLNNDQGIKGIYLTRDFGKPTQYFEIPIGTTYCNDIYIQSFNDSLFLLNIICEDKCKMFRFNDKDSFTLLHELPKIYPNFYITPGTGTVYNYGYSYTLLRSTDKGKTYTQPNWPNGNYSGGPPNFLKLKNGFIIDKSGAPFSYVSEDDGLNWKDFESYLEPDILYNFGANINSIGLKNWSDTLIIINDACREAGVYVSNDKGSNFIFKNKSLKEPKINWMYEDKSGNLYLSTCSSTSLFKSSDSGNSWLVFPIYINGYEIIINDMTEDKSGNIYLASSSKLLKSSDKGMSFNEVAIPPDKNDLWGYQSINIKGNYIFLLGRLKGIISSDNGVNWTDIKTDNTNYISYYIDSDYNMIYSIMNNVIKFNIQTGELDTLAFSSQNKIYAFHISKNGVIYYYSRDPLTNTYSLWKSLDLMLTSQKLIDNIKSIKSIFTDDNNNIYYEIELPSETNNTIYISKNEGINFTKFSITPTGSSGKIYLSGSQQLYAYKNGPAEIFSFFNKLSSGSLLEGVVYRDEDFDCIHKENDKFIKPTTIQISGADNKLLYSESGSFTTRLNPGNYNIIPNLPNPLWQSCDTTQIVVNGNEIDPIQVDLGLQIKTYCPYLSVQAQMPIARRCFDNNLYIKYCNEGTDIAKNVKITVLLDEKISYVSSNIIPYSQSGNVIIYELGDIPVGYCDNIKILTFVNCDAQLGGEVCVEVNIGPEESCAKNLTEISEVVKCNKVIGSYDPNEKIAFIDGKPTNGISEMNKDVEYIIRFQNTGTDTAFRVIIEDEIPKGFDLSTLKPLNSSHLYSLEIIGRKVKFIFDPIMLPDSTINEPASHGFVAFKITPNKDLPYGTKLDNYADIYFDFNDAVTTNTAYLTVTKTTSTTFQNNSLDFNYYPNPTKGELNIEIINDKSQNYTLRVSDLLGKELIKEAYKGSSYKMNSKTSLLPGIYFINVEGEDGKRGYGKFVVE